MQLAGERDGQGMVTPFSWSRKHRPLNDGAGLCSPGRWRIKDRRFPTSTPWRSTSRARPSLKKRWTKLCCAIAQRLENARYSHSRERVGLTVAIPCWRLMPGMPAAGEYPDTGVAEFAKGRLFSGRALQVRFADWPTTRSPTTYFSGSS